jgi:methyl-accepting chemotaxis protein
MSYAVKEVSQHASQTSNDIEEVNSLTDEGTRITHDAVEQMNRLSDSVQDAQSVISQLADNSQSIASVLDVIRGIAEQTNLLALNAAIEAARAGEQGRGFAVVADEVRTLASRTQESTQSIQEMIETLQTGVQQAVDSISKGSGLTEATVNLSQQTLTALENIGQACGRLSEVAIQTATATEEQSQVAEDISSNLTVLSDETKESFEVAQSNGVQANDTMGLATELSDSVTRFKLS